MAQFTCVLCLLMCLAQALGHSQVHQAWLADNGNKSLLVINAIPEFLMNSTVFSRLFGLRDPSIGDETATAGQQGHRPASGAAGSRVKVLEMSHKAVVYPTASLGNASHAIGQQQQQQRRLQQPANSLAVLTLWKKKFVDAFVSRLDRIVSAAVPPRDDAAPPLPSDAASPPPSAELSDADQPGVVLPAVDELEPSTAGYTVKPPAVSSHMDLNSHSHDDKHTENSAEEDHMEVHRDEEHREEDRGEHSAETSNVTEQSGEGLGSDRIVMEQHGVEDNSMEEPATGNYYTSENYGAEELAKDEHASEDFIMDKQAMEEVTTEEQAMEEVITNEQAMEELKTSEQTMKELTTDNQAIREPNTDEQAVDNLTANEQAMVEHAAEEQAPGYETSSMPTSTAEEFATDEPVLEELAAEQFVTDGHIRNETYTPSTTSEADSAPYPEYEPRHAPGSALRAEQPSAEAHRMQEVHFKPTAVHEGGQFDPAEFGLLSDASTPAAPERLAVRDSLVEAVHTARAGLLVLRPDWRGPGVLVTPLHQAVRPDTLCQLLVKRGACRCTRRTCAKFVKFMRFKCPGMCEEDVAATRAAAAASDAAKSRILPSVTLPEPFLGILSKCRAVALLVRTAACGADTPYVAHPIYCECYYLCQGTHKQLSACPSGEHFSTAAGETRVCVPFDESRCRTWSRWLSRM